MRWGSASIEAWGEPIRELDELGLEGRKVGLTYGYLEGEFGASNFVGLIGRIVLGLTDEGVNGGGQFFLRLGNDKLTNILLGGEVLGGIGLKGIAELQWNTIPRSPDRPSYRSHQPARGESSQGIDRHGVKPFQLVAYQR